MMGCDQIASRDANLIRPQMKLGYAPSVTNKSLFTLTVQFVGFTLKHLLHL
jgi:hypothetical protein